MWWGKYCLTLSKMATIGGIYRALTFQFALAKAIYRIHVAHLKQQTVQTYSKLVEQVAWQKLTSKRNQQPFARRVVDGYDTSSLEIKALQTKFILLSKYQSIQILFGQNCGVVTCKKVISRTHEFTSWGHQKWNFSLIYLAKVDYLIFQH